ncbi:hypothetical protein LU11_gp156 [Pseudomonas phage Lu11]|uniref:hypothetical protein n=1 Tax=Pseudomonas phage Lu11 TaxID=1161927 RepID=UPI00025F17C1|nr:hypothetical protein LU11_gp156 [Pseudomonas phage Lu11]AFH14687.1 hypothetical protein Lu11_0153A [Pseudomonas phage Lu11]
MAYAYARPRIERPLNGPYRCHRRSMHKALDRIQALCYLRGIRDGVWPKALHSRIRGSFGGRHLKRLCA